MNIDIPTLALALCVVNALLQVVVLFFQYLTNKTYRGIGWFLLWSASTALGFVFMCLWNVFPRI